MNLHVLYHTYTSTTRVLHSHTHIVSPANHDPSNFVWGQDMLARPCRCEHVYVTCYFGYIVVQGRLGLPEIF